MASIRPENWQPRGIDDLEHRAWNALRRTGSTCVVAGPGAGKTEFLAQKAVYFLETGLCPYPQRILAISFKSDAAANLAARVKERCPSSLASRFVSITFDAFTKSLVDRFLPAIPAHWRPSQPYDVAFPSRYEVQESLDLAMADAPVELHPIIAEFAPVNFESRHVGAYRLPHPVQGAISALEFAVYRWMAIRLNRPGRSSLSFVSLNRLAELVLRANPQIKRALRVTYPVVFVDEFQDTTFAQYDFLQSAFRDAGISVTAVGDDKQRIMAWAGARTDSFARFQDDFAAERIELQFNHRSSPELVRIQHVVARALDGETELTQAQRASTIDGDAAQVWASSSREREAAHLARWLADDMAARGLAARDYAILVRQKADEFEADLADEFRAAGIHIRNENRSIGRTTLQDLLVDDLSRIGLLVLRIGEQRKNPEAWQELSASFGGLRGIDPNDEAASQRLERELTQFLATLRIEMQANLPSLEASTSLVRIIFDFLDLASFARAYSLYGTGNLLEIMAEAFEIHLGASSVGATTWTECLNAFEGLTHLPLMTVHKSKGLEYDTIIFVGLDDHAWWSHTPENPEGLATFFVALSRAKQRAIFAFCEARGTRRKVADLFNLLTEAGVHEVRI